MNSFSLTFYRSSSKTCHHPGLLHLYFFRFYIYHKVGWYELPAVQKIHLHHCSVQKRNYIICFDLYCVHKISFICFV